MCDKRDKTPRHKELHYECIEDSRQKELKLLACHKWLSKWLNGSRQKAVFCSDQSNSGERQIGKRVKQKKIDETMCNICKVLSFFSEEGGIHVYCTHTRSALISITDIWQRSSRTTK